MNLRETSQLFYQLKLANQEMTSKFEKETGFSLTRYELLQFLKENGSCLQSALQEVLKIDSAAVTRHLKVLEEKNYVLRKRNPDNQREVFVQLTGTASSALSRCEGTHRDTQSLIQLNLSEEEAKMLLGLLKKIQQ